MRDDRRRHDDDQVEEPKIIDSESRRVRGRGDMRMRGSDRGGPDMGGRGDFRGGMGGADFRGGMGGGMSAEFMPSNDINTQAPSFNNEME